jgi:predicted transcriptional regulator of viral defense system
MSFLRDKVQNESFDYTFLMDRLSDYKSPRSKITNLLKSGQIIRVTKGLYVFGPKERRSLLNLESLANQIYGPSYVSLEYALAFYGLIPEYVAEVTCVTTKRQKKYETPIGRFSYTPIPVSLFSTGFTLCQITDYESALIATKEKALADLLYVRKLKIKTIADLQSLLFDNLRLDEAEVKKFHIGILLDILKAGGSPALSVLITWLRSYK